MYKVKQSDLKGAIKDFPIEVVQKMVERHIEQYGNANIEFKDKFDVLGYFAWKDTIEGFDFWKNVIEDKDFDVFFKRYPKSGNSQSCNNEFPLPPENMRVWIRGNKERGEEVIKALTDLGANNKYNYKGDDCESIYSIISGNNITATEKGYDKASLVANFYTEIKLPWKPKDKELVWTWDNDYEYCRELKFYDVKHDSTFTTIEGKRLGQSFDNYAPYEGEYPDWAKEAQKKLED